MIKEITFRKTGNFWIDNGIVMFYKTILNNTFKNKEDKEIKLESPKTQDNETKY